MISDERLFEVAVDYYANKKPQREIAAKLGVSHVQVGKYLKLAGERGIVEITLNPPFVNEDEQGRLEALFRQAFALEHIVIVPGTMSEKHSLDFLVEGASRYLCKEFPNSSLRVGMGLGRTITRLAHMQLKGSERKSSWRYYPLLNHNIAVAPDSGSPDQIEEFQSVKIASRFSENWGGSIGRDFKKQLEQVLSCDADSSCMDKLWKSLDVLIGGVGVSYSRDPNARCAMFGEEAARILGSRDIPGDYQNYYFDGEGNFFEPVQRGRYMMSMELIRKVPRKIAIAAGFEKVYGIIGLLKCHVVDTLITDLPTARQISQFIM